MQVIKFYLTLYPLNKFLDSLHGTLALIPVVRTTQFNTILSKPPVIIFHMRVNTCMPESVPRVIPHLETQITDTLFIQDNIKSGSPGMCSNIRPESTYAHTVYNRIHRQKSTKSSFILSEFTA